MCSNLILKFFFVQKKDAINNCCLKACKILDKAGLLFAWQKNNRIEKRKVDSDDEFDDLIDETGERESKKQRLELLKNKRVDNLDSLSTKLNELNVQIEDLQNELVEIDKEMSLGKSGSYKDEVELDTYVKKMSTNSSYSMNDLKIKKSKGKMKMSQLLKEKERTEKLIKVAQPSLTLASTIKKTVSSTSSSKASELIQKAQARLQKKQDVIVVPEKPVNKSVHTIELRRCVFEEEEEDKPAKPNLKFNKPAKLNPSSTFSLDDESETRQKSTLLKDEKDEKEDQVIEETATVNKNDANNLKDKRPLKSRDQDEIVEENEDNFCEWLPPEENDSESISLNDKYGY